MDIDLADKLALQLPAGEGSCLSTDNGSSPTKEKIQGIITRFICSIGIAIHEKAVEENTFLPGVRISEGALEVDKNKLLYPGDLLHEAGHIAVTPASRRPSLDEEAIQQSEHKDAEEMMAIAWSYAACIYTGIDPLIVFHEHGYKGGGSNIVENFNSGHYFGTPMLQACGMTTEPKRGLDNSNCFPKMIKWLRD